MVMERRKFVKSVGLATAAAYLSPKVIGNNQVTGGGPVSENAPAVEFPSLPYAYDALEPYIDARTMEIHYDKHHRTYFTNLVNAIKGTALENQNIEAIMKNVSASGDGVRNNGGGYYNHILFWNNMGKGLATPSSEMLKALEQAFTSFDKFKETLST